MLLLLKAVQLLVVLAYRRGLLAQLGALQTGGRLVLVGLAERVWGEPLVERQFAGIQRDALCDGGQGGGDGGGELFGVMPP